MREPAGEAGDSGVGSEGGDPGGGLAGGDLLSMQQGNRELSPRDVVTRRINLVNAEEGTGISSVA